jgi:hypothetical protein
MHRSEDVDEVPIASRDDAENTFKEFLSLYDAPAFVRRARRVEMSLEELLDHCHAQRERWLGMVRLRVGILRALAGDWNVLWPLLSSQEQVRELQLLHDELKPKLRVPVVATTSQYHLQQALEALRVSIESFNRRWQRFLLQVDLSGVNEARDAYNRYYVLEKECAFRCSRVAREGFVRQEPFTLADLQARLPFLPVPELAP